MCVIWRRINLRKSIRVLDEDVSREGDGDAESEGEREPRKCCSER